MKLAILCVFETAGAVISRSIVRVLMHTDTFVCNAAESIVSLDVVYVADGESDLQQVHLLPRYVKPFAFLATLEWDHPCIELVPEA